jgi:hypothetical protein
MLEIPLSSLSSWSSNGSQAPEGIVSYNLKLATGEQKFSRWESSTDPALDRQEVIQLQPNDSVDLSFQVVDQSNDRDEKKVKKVVCLINSIDKSYYQVVEECHPWSFFFCSVLLSRTGTPAG